MGLRPSDLMPIYKVVWNYAISPHQHFDGDTITLEGLCGQIGSTVYAWCRSLGIPPSDVNDDWMDNLSKKVSPGCVQNCPSAQQKEQLPKIFDGLTMDGLTESFGGRISAVYSMEQFRATSSSCVQSRIFYSAKASTQRNACIRQKCVAATLYASPGFNDRTYCADHNVSPPLCIDGCFS